MTYISQQTSYSRDMVHRWRQGHHIPSSETVEILLHLGKEDANLSREWGESLLHAVRHPDATRVANLLWEPKALHAIPCNLPPRDCTDLIGRQTEVARLLELLSPRHAAPLITVDGIGGVGKTALVLDVAYRCWKVSTGEDVFSGVPSFNAIMFVSAKQQSLTPHGILPGKDSRRTLRDIIREIASTLHRPEITQAGPLDQFERVNKALARQTTLLIVDNLETMEDKQEIMSFLYDLPSSVKVIITSRERMLLFSPIRLEQLSQEAALNLIEKEAQEKDAALDGQQAFELYRHIGGIPAALVYAVGQIASGYSLKTVLEKVPRAGSDVARFCFESSLGPLRGQPAQTLLLTIALFPTPPQRPAIASTAGLQADLTAVEDGLALLQRLSLITQREGGRYALLPLTREYALSELAAQPAFEKETRRRWVEWYRDFVEEYGGNDWDDLHIRYDKIEEEWVNLLAVFEWCAAHEQYKDIRFFWHEMRIGRFAHIYGYWDDRLLWLERLVQSDTKRGDWAYAVKAMVDLGFLYTLINQLDKADRLLQEAWNKHEYADPRVQLIVTQKYANLRLHQRQYSEALSWVDQAENLLKELTNPEKQKSVLDEREHARRLADFQSNRGLIYFKQKDYAQAEACYQKARELAQDIGWQRAVIYAQNHLAHIAIMQDKLDEAEAFLKTSLPVDKDTRLAAFHKQTRAYLYQKKRNMKEALRLAQEALEAFERLGMEQEAQEADALCKSLRE
jgi:LuxR family glucitol operon transcriptional activator